MAQPVYHASIEGAQHGARSLAQFLAYVRDHLCWPVAAGSFEDGMGS